MVKQLHIHHRILYIRSQLNHNEKYNIYPTDNKLLDYAKVITIVRI